MSTNNSAIETKEPLFDVALKLPDGVSQEEVEHQLATVPGISNAQQEKLKVALLSGLQVKIGDSITHQRVEGAKKKFSSTGFLVIVTPVLTLQKKLADSVDDKFTCPACNERVLLPANRQCPSCGVFVDKITEEFLLKKKIAHQERTRLELMAERDARETQKENRRLLEASLREQIRKELEAEFGRAEKYGIFKGPSGRYRALGLLSLVVIAFLGGNTLQQPIWTLLPVDGFVKENTPPEMEKFLKYSAMKSSPASRETKENEQDDVEDSLIKAGSNQTGKGITLEQALAAANTLGKSVGNTTADRAWNSTSVGTIPGNGISQTSESIIQNGVEKPTVVKVDNATKLQFMTELVLQLSAIGQLNRAQEILAAINTKIELASEPNFSNNSKRLELDLKAWGLGLVKDKQVNQVLKSLRAEANSLKDPVERAATMGRLAVILSRQLHVGAEASYEFLSMAGRSLNAISDPTERENSMKEWTLHLAEVYLWESDALAKEGRWGKLNRLSSQMALLIEQATGDATLAKLHAINHQIQKRIGQESKATQSLQYAIALATNMSDLNERAIVLTQIAEFSGASSSGLFQAAITSFVDAIDSKVGLEKAKALNQIGIFQASTGSRDKAEQFFSVARAVDKLPLSDSTHVLVEQTVRGPLASAVWLHREARYAESEKLLRQVADYLF